MSNSRILQVTDLTVRTAHRELVHQLSFHIDAGERVGIIGESGSGKSLTATSIMGLLPQNLRAGGSITFGTTTPVELLGRSERFLARLRGTQLAMVFQEPMTALNPLMTVGAQISEIMAIHNTFPGERDQRVIELLESVQIPDAPHTIARYPHQLSGGQRQRVMLAMAMANSPALLLADEPTTALDVTVQAEVLKLMRRLVAENDSALLFISHDLAVVASMSDRIIVMNGGTIVETGTTLDILTHPQHPYTRRLLAASDLSKVDDRGRLFTVDTVSLPILGERGEPNKPATETRLAISETTAVASGADNALAPEHLVSEDGTIGVVNAHPNALFRLRDVEREYRRPGLAGRRTPPVKGLAGVSFDVRSGQKFGIVGESGSGKSTLLRIMCALDAPTAGTVTFRDAAVDTRRERTLRDFRSDVQIVFQDPMGSLDPRMTIGQIVAEPLRTGSEAAKRARVAEILLSVGIGGEAMDRHPHQFSGGQRQRISIARALATKPQVLIADEAVSALDVSVRAQVLNLFADLADEYDLTLIFVSHDLGVIRHACDTVVVLKDGIIVEGGPIDDISQRPQHPYTQRLVAASPGLEQILEEIA